MRKSIVISIVLLVTVMTSLGAASVEAEYEEQATTTIRNSSDFGIQSTGFPVALHVGTLTIDTKGNGKKPDLYSVRINRSGNFGGGIEYWLISSKEINWSTRFGAQLVAKIMFGDTTIVKPINWSNGLDPLIDGSGFSSNQYPITIEFYLGIRNIFSSDQAQGAFFQFEGKSGPNLGNFKIQYKKNTGNSGYQDIPFKTGGTPQPLFVINYNAESKSFLNNTAVIDTTVKVSLSIEQTPAQTSIDLLSAANGSKASVGTARLTLTGYNRPSPQGVTLTFADGNGSTFSTFRLKHTEVAVYIPFILYLGGETVKRGEPIPWNDLAFGANNLKNLEVGGITDTTPLAGKYSDTITVTIIPLDTNMVGL